jgi:hypothetical protein
MIRLSFAPLLAILAQTTKQKQKDKADTHCAARSPGGAGLGQPRAMVIFDDGPVNDLKCMFFPHSAECDRALSRPPQA